MELEDSAPSLVRFRQLMREIEDGETRRTTFARWEVELLVDMTSSFGSLDRRRTLEAYRRAVERGIENGASRLPKLSEYLDLRLRAAKRQRSVA